MFKTIYTVPELEIHSYNFDTDTFFVFISSVRLATHFSWKKLLALLDPLDIEEYYIFFQKGNYV